MRLTTVLGSVDNSPFIITEVILQRFSKKYTFFENRCNNRDIILSGMEQLNAIYK